MKPTNKVITNYALQNSIAPQNISFKHNEMIVDDIYTRTYYISQYSSHANLKWLYDISNVMQDIITTIHFKEVKQDIILKQLEDGISTSQRKINELNYNKAIEQEYAIKSLNDNKTILKLLTDNKESLINISITFLIKAHSKEKLINKCQKFRTTLNAKGFYIKPLVNFGNSTFKTSSPTCKTDDDVFNSTNQLMTVSNFCKGFINASSTYIDKGAFPLCKTLDNQTLFIDTWKRNTNFTNGNICIFGTTGSGKSTIAKFLLALEWANNVKCVVLSDPERDFKEITENLKGSWINVNGKLGKINPLQINIRQSDKDIEDVSNLSLHIQNVKTFIKFVFPDINTIQETILGEKLLELYNKFNIDSNTDLIKFSNNDFPLFSDLYDYMSKDKRKDNEYKTLLAYIKDLGYGTYQELWNYHTNITMDNNLICFDTSTLQKSKDNIKQAQYFLILNLSWEYATKNRNEKVRLFLDEAHLLLSPKNIEAMEVLKSIQKRCRKYETATTLITQDISDFLFDEVKMYGLSLLEASSIKIVLGTSGKSLENTIQTLKLPEKAITFLEKRERGKALLDIVGSFYLAKFDIPDFILKLIGKSGR